MNTFVLFALTEMSVDVKSMGSSQCYGSIKRDKTGALSVVTIILQIRKNSYR